MGTDNIISKMRKIGEILIIEQHYQNIFLRDDININVFMSYSYKYYNVQKRDRIIF